MEIKIREKFGWSLYKGKGSNVELWFSGYLIGEKNIREKILELVVLSQDIDICIEKLSTWVNTLSGDFYNNCKMTRNTFNPA